MRLMRDVAEAVVFGVAAGDLAYAPWASLLMNEY
jgi:hypothetical protein